MSIIGIGVDTVYLPRIAALLNRRAVRFPSRILSQEEHSSWLTLSKDRDKVRFLAVRWSVKESAYKAVYPTHRPTWKEFTYRSLTDARKPQLIFHPFESRLGTKRNPLFHVSVSHDGDYVFTTVVALRASSQV